MGKYILPWFGGGPGVWTTCVLFFQIVLLAGYAYAHFSSRYLKPKAQVVLHMVLLLAGIALLPITPGSQWKPVGGANPVTQILGLLAANLGLPYFVLSATGPLMQQWFSRTNPGVSPYRLYALSNLGSLLALGSYPFWFETHLTRRAQASWWGWGLGIYAVCTALCAWKVWSGTKSDLGKEGSPQRSPSTPAEPRRDEPGEGGSWGVSIFRKLMWLLLPFCASALLLGVTNKLCLDVAVVPFLWVAPLALYLLSFIISFDNPRWYVRPVFALALILAVGFLCFAIQEGVDWPLKKQIAAYCGGLFVCCMVCHGELYRLRPDPRQLTSFYLMISAGGALGGLFVAVAAPMIFKDFYELHWSLFLCAVLFAAVCAGDALWGRGGLLSPALSSGGGEGEGCVRASWRWLGALLTLAAVAYAADRMFATWLNNHKVTLSDRGLFWVRMAISAAPVAFLGGYLMQNRKRGFRLWQFAAVAWLLIALFPLGSKLWKLGRDSDSDIVSKSRNFYGVLTVYEYRKAEPEEHYYMLQHGRITHGLQFTDPDKARMPTSYYSEGSGAALAVQALPTLPRRIGVVGLGTGTFSAFGRAGDYVRIYEINPEVPRIASSPFSYLKLCKAKVDIAMGDARLSMEKEEPQHFDLLALDAFSSDAIPVHLLTKEAFALYERHLATNGILVVHISNHYLDLQPVVAKLAQEFKYHMAVIDCDESDEDWWVYPSTWILLSRDASVLDQPAIRAATAKPEPLSPTFPLWTDDFTSLVPIIKWE